MALSFSVFNKFKAIDGVTAPVRKMAKNVGRFGRKTVKAFRDSDRRAKKFSRTLKTLFAGAVIVGGIALLSQGIRTVTTQFIEFDDSIIAAGARFKDIGPDVDDFTERIKGIKAAAREAGATTEFTAAQSAQALDFLARAGFKSTEAIGSLVSMIDLATASGEDFASVADMSSDLLGAFGLASDNTAQKIKNLNRLNDVLVKTVNTANVTVTDMFETMKQVGPIATGVLGASLEEVAALTAVLGSSGIKGSEAMTALKNAYLRLAAPTSNARKLLDAMQISLDDGLGGARKMTDVMSDLGVKISGLGKIQQAQILNELFGKRAIAGGKNLIDNIKNIKKFEKSLLSAGGASQKTAELMRTSLGNRLKTLNSTLIEFGFKILENFELKGKSAIDAFVETIRGIDVAPIVKSLKSIVDISVKLFNIFMSIARFINEVFIKSIMDINEINKEIIPTIGIVIGIIVGLKIAIIALSAAAGVLTAILAVNPFTLFIVATAAVILAIRAIIKNWDQLKVIFKPVIEGVLDLFERFKTEILAVSLLIGILAAVNPFVLFLIATAAVILAIRSIIKNWDFLKNAFKIGFEFIANLAVTFWAIMKNNFTAGVEFLTNIVSNFVEKISNAFPGIGIAIGSVIENWDLLFSKFKIGFEFLTGLATNFGKEISEVFSGIGEKFKKFTGGIGGKVLKLFQFGSKEEAAKKPSEVPISPNAGLAQTIRTETESRSRVSVDFSNLPKGSEVKQSGDVPGFDLALGFAGLSG